MAIHMKEALALVSNFHEETMRKKQSPQAQAAFFLHSNPLIYLLHGDDITLEQNYRIHQKLTDEQHINLPNWELVQLCQEPERARLVGGVYWQGRIVDSQDVVKCIVGEDWIIQKTPSGELKIVLLINSYHHFLPDSAAISF